MREVDHRPKPRDARGQLEHVVDRAELAHPAHDFDAERDRAALLLEAVAQGFEPRDDVVERLRAVPPEPEARMDDDDLGAGGCCDPRGAVERAEGLLRLPLVGVAGEGEQRRVHGQRDVVLAATSRSRSAHG